MASSVSLESLVKEIHYGLTQKNSSSQKDEIRVMQAMLNDTDFKVGIYGNNGKEGEYCPAEDFRSMIGSIIYSAAKTTKEEARTLAASHEATKSDAASMVNISKEYVNTYMHTGRKLPLGGREGTNFFLCGKEVKERTKPCPKKVGYADNGDPIYETPNVKIPAHLGLKAYSSCPKWVK